MPLYDYQQAAHDKVIEYVKSSTLPCLVEAATGAGKSHIIAELATTLNQLSRGKNVLSIQPSAKLLKQNRAKFLVTGRPASIFSASGGAKCLRHAMVFATPITVAKNLKRFTEAFCAIIVDEAHGVTPTVLKIIEHMREINPNIRVIGLTATPYRAGEGYIYRIDEDNNALPEEQCAKAYFHKLVYRIRKRELEERGRLTPALVGEIGAEQYDLSDLPRKKKPSDDELDRVYLGQGRATALILADVLNQCKDRAAVMIFAATVRHAKEIAESLPASQVRVIGGDTNMGKGRQILEDDFEAVKFKYLVSVGTMTTGVDFPHVDAIVLMRYIESPNLVEQIIGRGARLHPGKTNFLLLDYGDNLERHYGEDIDLYNPIINIPGTSESHGFVPSLCPMCATINQFAARHNPDGLGYDDEGYFTDLAGDRIETEHGPVPGHFGRRCRGMIKIGGKFEQCSHRWTDKKCYECDASNDIAARYCKECKAEIVDPNQKLVVEFRKRKKDASLVQCDKVLNIEEKQTYGPKGDCLRLTVTTEYRTFDFWLFPEATNKWLQARYKQYLDAKEKGIHTVTYRKNLTSKFFEVHAYNEPADEVPQI
jgi:DNA repair protein RadD